MRTHSAVLLLAVSVAACGSAARSPGASFAGSSLLAPASEAEEAHDGLLRADLGRSDSVARLGYAPGLAGLLTTDVLYLRGGLPIVRGRSAALAIVAAESVGSVTTIRWQPVRAEASSDGRSGYTYGYAVYSASQAGAPTVRIDRYIAFWRREQETWRIAAYAETYGVPPATLSLPTAARASELPDVPMPTARGALDAMRNADVEFSHEAGVHGTGAAFGHYAASDAQVFSAPGEFISGPDAIMQSFGSTSTESSLAWHPVAGEVSSAGDLGVTVGNAVFTARRADGAPTVSYSKYLTVWKRQRDGRWRYVVDGGSARPNE